MVASNSRDDEPLLVAEEQIDVVTRLSSGA